MGGGELVLKMFDSYYCAQAKQHLIRTVQEALETNVKQLNKSPKLEKRLYIQRSGSHTDVLINKGKSSGKKVNREPQKVSEIKDVQRSSMLCLATYLLLLRGRATR